MRACARRAQDSDLAGLLSLAQREAVADVVNAALLATRAARAWPRASPRVRRARGAGAPARLPRPCLLPPASWSRGVDRRAGPRRLCVCSLFRGLSDAAARRVPSCCLPRCARGSGRHTQPLGRRTHACAAWTKACRAHCLSTARAWLGALWDARASEQSLQATCSRAGGARAAAAAAGDGARRGARGEWRLRAAVRAAASAAAAAGQAATCRTSPGRRHGRVGPGRRPGWGGSLSSSAGFVYCVGQERRMRHVYSSCLRGVCTLTVVPGRSLGLCWGGSGLVCCLLEVHEGAPALSCPPRFVCRCVWQGCSFTCCVLLEERIISTGDGDRPCKADAVTVSLSMLSPCSKRQEFQKHSLQRKCSMSVLAPQSVSSQNKTSRQLPACSAPRKHAPCGSRRHPPPP